MPGRGNGAHCAIFGCSTCRKHGLSLFRLPTAKNDRFAQWRSDMINSITKDRVADAVFKNKVEKNTIFICERHFREEDMYHYPSRKELRAEAYPLPTQNLPQKSLPIADTPQRSTTSIQKRDQYQQSNDQGSIVDKKYKNFQDFVKRADKLKLPRGWKITHHEQLTEVVKEDESLSIPAFQIFINSNTDLSINLRCYGWLLPKESPIMKEIDSLNDIYLSDYIQVLESYHLCKGINLVEFQKAHHVTHHVIPKKFKFEETLGSNPLHQDEFKRSQKCHILLKNKEICSECSKFEMKLRFEIGQKRKVSETPASNFAPLSVTSKERVVLTLKATRQENKKLKAENDRLTKQLQEALHKNSVDVQEDLSDDLMKIFDGVPQENITPFMRLFWTEQMKYIRCTNKKQLRYHPAIIKYCLNICAKSSAAYKQLKLDLENGTGVLVLPSQRTLRQYRNYVKPEHGFNPQITKDLAEMTAGFSSADKYVSIVIDEMKVQEDLVWDRSSGELIGFLDLGNESMNESTITDREKLASHVMVFLVKSIKNKLSFSFANFATDGASAAQIHLLFWKCVAILEISCQLKVICTVSDGASTNRKFIKMNKGVDDEKCTDVTYRTKNLYAPDRYIYFIADPPHLIKTARNALWKSGNDISGRYMWNNECYLFWKHIKDLFFEDLEYGLKSVTHLTTEHVMLNSYSVMNVKLAASVLSESTCVSLQVYGPPGAKETALFCRQFDKFFDCFNVKDTQQSKKKIKPFLKKYESEDDVRFNWLNSFIAYLDEWKQNIAKRPGEFTQTQRNNMFISLPTYEGIKISIKSLQEIIPYLLRNGFDYVLSENFCQDDLENYFGRQRAIGSRKTNPNSRDTIRNDRIIKNQLDPRPIEGGNCPA